MIKTKEVGIIYLHFISNKKLEEDQQNALSRKLRRS